MGRILVALGLWGFTAMAQSVPSELRVKRVVGIEYPWFARMAVLQGNVELIATISQDGVVEKISVASGAPILAGPAKEAMSKWLFSGCESQSSGCEVKTTFSFTLSGVCGSGACCPTELQFDLPNKVSVKSTSAHAVVN
jgi:hypothetical protein